MTAKLFWQDPYLTQLQTCVASVQDDEISLEQTIFYAFSGAQESDAGTINDLPVIEARKDGSSIVYKLQPDHGLRPGDAVNIKIDWERRYKLMRLHFAAEIILALAYQNFHDITKIGAHIGQDKARIDFEWAEILTPTLPALKAQAHWIIQANYPITSAYSDEAAQKRYWEIAGFAQVPCGGTHLKTTGEVGLLELERKNIGKGKERIQIYLADASLSA